MINIKARNVRLRQMDTTDKACRLLAEFLASTGREEELLEEFLMFLCSRWNRCLTSKDIGAFRKRHGVAESSLHRFLSQLEKNEVIRKVPSASHERQYLYYLHENFGKALYKVLRAYRRKMLPPRPRHAGRSHGFQR